MLALLREISFRHWSRSPLRTLLVVLGIALGVGLYVATEAAGGSMLSAFGEFVARVSGRADLTIQREGSGVPSEIVGTVSEVPGVAHVAASLELTAQAPELGETLLVLGVDFLGDLHFLPFKVKEGDDRVIEDPLAFVNDPTAILIARRFATKHGIQKDGRLVLLTSDGAKAFHVRGILEDSGPAASFAGQVAVMFIDAAQVSFARGTLVDRIDVAVSPGQSVAGVAERIQKVVGKELAVEPPERIGSRLRALVDPLRSALAASGFLAMLVGAFLIYNAVGVAVAQRTREIGILRALGLTRRGTVALFCFEATMVALPGILLGLLLGRILSTYSMARTVETLNQFIAPVASVPARLEPTVVLRGVFAGLVTTMLAAWWPARRGAAIDPAIVLRGSSSVERSPLRVVPMLFGGLAILALTWLPIFGASRRWGLLAVLLTMIGAAFTTPAIVVAVRRVLVGSAEALFGLPARLGLDYVERTLGRSTVSVLALMVAVGLSVTVGGWLASLERSMASWVEQVGASDLVLTQGSPLIDRRHVPLSSNAVARVARLPGIDRVQPLRIVEQAARGTTFRLVATDTEAFLAGMASRGKGWSVVEGAKIGIRDLTDRPRIVISENAAHRLRLHAGDTLVLRGAKSDVPFEVLAVVVDFTSESGAGFIDRRYFLEHWGDDAIDSVSVYLSNPDAAEAVVGRIRAELGGTSGVFVTSMTDLKEQVKAAVPKLFAYSRAVEVVTLIIALMGVVGTMVAAVIDRKREIGTLRAIGASPRQVATSIVVEALFIGVCAVIAGIGVGAVECLVFLRRLFGPGTGWHLDFVFPWLVSARIGGLVVLTSALAGWLPALRAARADAKAAVVYE